jgi:glycosyltransferase involved in cell wall biosynthesis
MSSSYLENTKANIDHDKSILKNLPKVSIGMPVYNGQLYIRKALDSLLAQTFTDFELIISDNASTDGTLEICIEYAKKDCRIRLYRQKKNTGALFNFNFVLDRAISEYFMWAAADDTRSPDFIELNLKFLINNPGFVASTSPVRFEDGNFDPKLMGDFSLFDNDKFTRVNKFFNGWHANGRFYSLILRKHLINFPYRMGDYVGADWVWVIHLAINGKLNRHEKGWVLLGISGISNTTNIFKKHNIGPISFLIPLREMFINTIKLSGGLPSPLIAKISLEFLKLNLSALIMNIVWTFRDRKF